MEGLRVTFELPSQEFWGLISSMASGSGDCENTSVKLYTQGKVDGKLYTQGKVSCVINHMSDMYTVIHRRV